MTQNLLSCPIMFWCLVLFILINPLFSDPFDSTAYLLKRLPEGSATRGKVQAQKSFYRGSRRYQCSTCHAFSEHPYQKRRFPGPPLKDSYYRSSFANRRHEHIHEAVKYCMVQYQSLPDDETTNKDSRDVTAWLRSVSSPVTTSPWPYLGPPKTIPDGIFSEDMHRVTEGQVLYENSCFDCHESRKSMSLLGKTLSREDIYRRLRGMKILVENNPQKAVYDLSRLSDEDLTTIISFLMHSQRKL